jgi:hypothetical protein
MYPWQVPCEVANVARTLDHQGEIELAGDVRYFARNLPRVHTDRERLAAEFIAYVNRQRAEAQRREDLVRDRRIELTR